jgi:AcrR family transcriptional regulator
MPAGAASSTTSRQRGRPREFDIDAVLDKSVDVFRERGYNATSIQNLTEAMDLASGSVYKAFKDKKAIFLAAFDREAQSRRQKLRQAISASKSGRERIYEALVFFAEASHGAEGKRGCLIVGTAAELATLDIDVKKRVTLALDRIESLVAKLIREGQLDGTIGTHVDAQATARAMLCLLQGMRVVGKTGRQRPEMMRVAEVALNLLI